MSFTWTNSVKANFGSGGAHLSGQGPDSLYALLVEAKAKMDELDTRVAALEVTATTTTTTTTTTSTTTTTTGGE